MRTRISVPQMPPSMLKEAGRGNSKRIRSATSSATPFRPAAFSPAWCIDTASPLARQMYESRDFSAMPILADAFRTPAVMSRPSSTTAAAPARTSAGVGL